MIRTPYLLFLGDAPDQLAAKVAQGIADWNPDAVVGQYRMAGCKADVGVQDMSLQEAYDKGARTLVVGVANRGGMISESWLAVLAEAMEIGYDLASGLHNLLRDEDVLKATSARSGATLHDVRVPTVAYPIANGKKAHGQAVSCHRHGLLGGQDVYRPCHEQRDGGARDEIDVSGHRTDRHSGDRARCAAGRG